VQILTFNGNVKVNTRWQINTTNGQAVQTRVFRQEMSGDSAEDWLGPRDDSSTDKNGHFTVTANP
jgi:hypothetical protein